MSRSSWLLSFSALALLAIGATPRAQAAHEQRLPNIVIIFADDQGYADLGTFGAQGYETPNIDAMAAEGRRFTNFYCAQAVCSASRCALLTGCYPNRLSISGALNPKSTHGLHHDETTLAEVCKQRGYATAIYGKWHLGHHPEFLPVHHGFDDYYGLPYSNDMWPYHPENRSFPALPMIEDDRVVDADVTADEQTQLTTSYTERAVQFIDQNKDRPFFLYVPHSMPHVPLFTSDKFKGRSQQGAYGDVIMEIDWSVGQIRQALERHGLTDNTLVVYTTDNGPWLSYGNHAGSAGPLREGKGTAWEGGVRVPAIMCWPGTIPAGTVCDEPLMTIDLLPTVAGLLDVKLDASRPIDGLDAWAVISGQEGAESPHEALYFYWGSDLHAVRSGKWKLHFPHAYRSLEGEAGKDGTPSRYVMKETGLALYDLDADMGETTNLAEQHPEVVERLTALADTIRAELGDKATQRKGTGVRPAAELGAQ